MSKELIVKANALVEASYHLSANEQRLILSAIAQMGDKPITDNEVYYVSAKDMEALGVNKTTAYRELYEAGERLFLRTVTLRLPTGTLKTRWVQDLYKFDGKLLQETSDIPFMDLQVSVGVRFSKSVLPFLNSLTSNFTKYMLSDIAGFSSHYSYRFYEFIMQFQSTGFIKISINALRERLDLGDKYQATKDFRKWVLETAINEINKKSPYKVDYKLIKTGKKFTHLELRFKRKEIDKKNNKDIAIRDPNTADMFTKLTDKQLARIVHSKKFIGDYNGLVSAQNPANQSSSAWVAHMVEWLKKDPDNFTKRPMQEYLDDEQAQRF